MYISVTLVNDTKTCLWLYTNDFILRQFTLLVVHGGEALVAYNRAALTQSPINSHYDTLRKEYEALDLLCEQASPRSSAEQQFKNNVRAPSTRTTVTIDEGQGTLGVGAVITLSDPGLGSRLPLVQDIVKDLAITR